MYLSNICIRTLIGKACRYLALASLGKIKLNIFRKGGNSFPLASPLSPHLLYFLLYCWVVLKTFPQSQGESTLKISARWGLPFRRS